MNYDISARAERDLEEIQRFILIEKENPDGARIVVDYLVDAFEKIGSDPARCGGRARSEITRLPHKFLAVRKYVVVYDRSLPVRIMTILGGSQDLPAAFRRARCDFD